MKSIVVMSFITLPRFRFTVTLIFFIAFGSNQVVVVYLNLLLSFYSNYKSNYNLIDNH